MAVEPDAMAGDRVTSEDKLARYEAALQSIVQWADAYPTVERRPDLLQVWVALKQAGISPDRVLASVGHSITKDIGAIARDALTGGQ
jgi:hypothetical protein